MRRTKRTALGLVEVILALAVFALLLAPLTSLFQGATQRVTTSRAQLMLRVRCIEGLDLGRSKLYRGDLAPIAGESFEEVSGDTILRVQVEVLEDLKGALLLKARAEYLELAYSASRVVAIPHFQAGREAP